MNGYVCIDKPSGWTSFDVVNKIRGISETKKVGHSGTLDPFATGLLIILLGNHTKRQEELMKQDKTYEVTAVLGKVSATGDPEGEISRVSEQQPSEAALRTALASFTGQISQIPPIYSAIKINGKKAYEMARAGKEVEMKAREVTVYSIEEVEYVYPTMRFTTRVSSGTYIRSLVSDIGESLGVGAYTTELRRTSIGEMTLEDALPMEGITKEIIEGACKELH